MKTEDGASTIDVRGYSKDAVLFFLGALTNGSLKAVPLSIFRDANRLANKFQVNWMIAKCFECFESMVEAFKDDDFPSQLNIFDEAMYGLIELEKNDFFDLIKKKFASEPSLTEKFILGYLTNISSCSAKKLDAILEISANQEYILVKVLIDSIELDKSSLNTNTRRVLERLDFTNYSLTHVSLYNDLLDALGSLENPSKEDYCLTIKILRQSFKRNNEIRYNSQSNSIAFPNLFLDFYQLKGLSSDEIIIFLVESPMIKNSYIFYDTIETWLVNNSQSSNSVLKGLFSMIFSNQVEDKLWKPLAREYLIAKANATVETLATEIMRRPNLITDTGYHRVTSTLEYIPEDLFSLDHDIELMNQNSTNMNNSGIAKNHAFLLKVQAATVNDPFDIQLVSNLTLFNEEFHLPEYLIPPELIHKEPLLFKTIHFTLDIKKEDGKFTVNVPVGWYNRPRRDVSGLVVQFVAESRFANREFANLFFDFDELQFS